MTRNIHVYINIYTTTCTSSKLLYWPSFHYIIWNHSYSRQPPSKDFKNYYWGRYLVGDWCITYKVVGMCNTWNPRKLNPPPTNNIAIVLSLDRHWESINNWFNVKRLTWWTLYLNASGFLSSEDCWTYSRRHSRVPLTHWDSVFPKIRQVCYNYMIITCIYILNVNMVVSNVHAVEVHL